MGGNMELATAPSMIVQLHRLIVNTALVLVQGLHLQHEVVAGVAEVAVEGRGHPVPVCHPWS